MTAFAALPDNLHVDTHENGQATVLAVRGELDLASSSVLDNALQRAQESSPALLIVDLSELQFMDSTGLSVIVRAHQRMQDAGGELCLVRGSAQVQRLLSLTGIDERMTIADTRQELLARDLRRRDGFGAGSR